MNDKRHVLLETLATVLMAVATVATAWCAYQSTVWASEQEFALHEADMLSREVVELRNKGLLTRQVDVDVFLTWGRAYTTGDSVLKKYLESTMEPPMRAALEAWVALRPAINLDAPRHPFRMEQYWVQAERDADSVDVVYQEAFRKASDSNSHSEHYVLLTVILASVLFFGGITSNIDSIKTKTAMVIGSSILLISSVIWMLTFPMIIR